MSSSVEATVFTAPADARPSVLVYRREFLPLSETFIADHIRGLTSWRAVAACDRLSVNGLPTAELSPHLIYAPHERRLARWRTQFLGRNAALDLIVAHHDIRILHAHFLTDAARIVAYARRRRIPLVVTAHGFDATLYLREQLRRGDFRFLQLAKPFLKTHASRFICVSEFIKSQLANRGYPPHKLTVCHLGVDRAGLAASALQDARSGVLFVGRLVEKKGLRHLIRAWEHLPAALKLTSLTVIGEGPLRIELEQEATERGVPVEFLGAKAREVVLDYMRRSAVFVLPSLRASTGDSEGMPIVAMEAQALSTPVVVFDDGPGSEVIAPGRSGLTVEAGDERALADAISRLLLEEGLGRTLGANGPVVVEERFDLAQNISRLEAIYNDVVAAPS